MAHAKGVADDAVVTVVDGRAQGELALVTPHPRRETATTSTDCQLFTFQAGSTRARVDCELCSWLTSCLAGHVQKQHIQDALLADGRRTLLEFELRLLTCVPSARGHPCS